MTKINSELDSLDRGSSGAKAKALEKGRKLVDDLEGVLRDAADGEPPEERATDGFEEYETVDVSEGKKRP